ncbi:MAG: hypothetical protein ACI8S6_005593 [Myxococcota bacterium]|jgi:hypothetical protein
MARCTARALLLLGLSTPALAQSPDEGTLNIDSPVAGAQVYIDNDLQGEAPLSVALSPGMHMVRVSADGYDPFVRRIDVPAGAPTELRATMTPGAGSVEFMASAPSAMVRLADGTEWALPVRLSPSDVSFGAHDYTITAPAHAPSIGDFDFRSGHNVFIFAQMESNAGRVTIDSTPAGAAVFIDGAHVGPTPLSLDGYAPGIYTIRLELDRHASVFRTLDTTDNDIGIIEARLPERGARLVVKTGHSDAEVFVEGQSIGTGSKVQIPELERRQYEIEVRAPGAKPALTRLDMPSSGRLTYRAELEEASAQDSSQLVYVPPLTRRWGFWTATGVGAAAAAAGGAMLYSALQPVPVPNGDVVVILP